MSCDGGEGTESFENELCSFSKPFFDLPTSQLFLQPFRCFTYVTVHSLTLLSLLLSHKLSSLSLGPASLATALPSFFWHSKTTASEKTVYQLFYMLFLKAIQLQAFKPGEKARRRSLVHIPRALREVIPLYGNSGFEDNLQSYIY